MSHNRRSCNLNTNFQIWFFFGSSQCFCYSVPNPRTFRGPNSSFIKSSCVNLIKLGCVNLLLEAQCPQLVFFLTTRIWRLLFMTDCMSSSNLKFIYFYFYKSSRFYFIFGVMYCLVWAPRRLNRTCRGPWRLAELTDPRLVGHRFYPLCGHGNNKANKYSLLPEDRL